MKLKSVFLAILILTVYLCFVAPVFAQDQVKSRETQQKIDDRKSLPLTREDVEKKPVVTEEATEPEAAQEEAQQPVSVQAEPRPVVPQIPQSSKAPATISFFFDDADIFEVVQTIFADVLKVNYIIDPQVKGRVNFRTVTPIPKDQVLPVMEIIFRMNGIGFVEEGGLYRIIPLADVSKELVFSQIGKTPGKVAIEMFAFKNLDLKEAMPDIENALGLQLQGGTVRILPIFRLNALIVVASSQQQLDYIRQWIEVFDKMFAVAKPKIFVYPLQNSKAEHIASLLQSIFSGTASTPSHSPSSTSSTPAKTTGTVPAQPQSTAPKTGVAATVSGGGGFVSPETRAFADEITNALIILATPTDYSFIEETIKKLDVLPRQVMIEALIAEVTLKDEFSLGFAWSIKTDIKVSGIKPFLNDVNLDGQIGQSGSTLSATGANVLSGSGFTFLATDPTGIVRARLDALTTDSKARILASPRITVLDNREAKIQIGDQVPVSTSETTYASSDTGNITRTIQYKDTGVILKIKPQINAGGLVTLELTQEVSNFYTIALKGSGEQVAISKREVTTNLVAQDGQTIVIGGLISEDNTDTKSGIPFLSKIPIIGPLFGSTTNTKNRKELVILLTPHVIRSQQEAGSLTSEYLQRLDKSVKKDVDRLKGGTNDKDINKFIKEPSSSNADKKDTK